MKCYDDLVIAAADIILALREQLRRKENEIQILENKILDKNDEIESLRCEITECNSRGADHDD